MNKIYISIAIAIMMIVIMPSSATNILVPEKTVIIPNNEGIMLPILVTNAENGIGGVYVEVSYRNNVVSCTNIIPEEINFTTYALINEDNIDSYIRYGAVNVPEGLNKTTSTILYLELIATGNCEYYTPITITNYSFFNKDYNKEEATIINGTIQIAQLGDVNLDGIVGMKDGILTLLHVHGWATLEYPSIADMNNDGKITNHDAFIIINSAFGIE